jgi:hypothetical protein
VVTGTTTFSPRLDHTKSSRAGDDVAVSMNMAGAAMKSRAFPTAILVVRNE